MNRLLRLVVRMYRWLVSPLLPPSCRFHPSCSEYAEQALHRHGSWRGGWLATKHGSFDNNRCRKL